MTGAIYKHRKRGTNYELVGQATVQASIHAIHEGDQVVVYRALDGGRLWIRPVKEFHDGRFEKVCDER